MYFCNYWSTLRSPCWILNFSVLDVLCICISKKSWFKFSKQMRKINKGRENQRQNREVMCPTLCMRVGSRTRKLQASWSVKLLLEGGKSNASILCPFSNWQDCLLRRINISKDTKSWVNVTEITLTTAFAFCILVILEMYWKIQYTFALCLPFFVSSWCQMIRRWWMVNSMEKKLLVHI